MKNSICNNRQSRNGEDVWKGMPANGLIWSLNGKINYQSPPTEESFYSNKGKKYLISGSYKHKTSRQKERAGTWYLTHYNDVEYSESEEGDSDVFTWKTPVGRVVGKRHDNHFTEYPLKSVDDLKIWTHIYNNMTFSLNPEWLGRTNIQGLTGIGLNWSPVQQLIQFDTGLDNFYYFLEDAPSEMGALLRVMQSRCMDRLRLGLSNFPDISYVYWGENTSSSSISPNYYKRLTLPNIKEYADTVHGSGKRLIVHMCGLLKNLLDCFGRTGMDGIHSVTPPPFGDTPYGLIREKFKDDFTIIGRFNAQLWMGKSIREIQETLKKTVTGDLLETPFALMVTDDAIPDISYDEVMNLYEALEGIEW